MLSTRGGSPASASSSTKRSPSAGVSVAGLNTTVLPQTSAGAIFQDGMAIGKFHGVIAPTTPIGIRTLMLNLSRSSEGVGDRTARGGGDGPPLLERRLGCVDGAVDIFRRGAREDPDRVAGGRID